MHVTHSVQITGIAKIQLVKAEGQNSSITQCTTCTTWLSYYSPAAWVHRACYEFINLSTYSMSNSTMIAIYMSYSICFLLLHMLLCENWLYTELPHVTWLYIHTPRLSLILYLIFDMILYDAFHDTAMLWIKWSTFYISINNLTTKLTFILATHTQIAFCYFHTFINTTCTKPLEFLTVKSKQKDIGYLTRRGRRQTTWH